MVLFANWCKKLNIFQKGIKEMGEYLQEKFNCKYYLKTNITKQMIK